MIHSLSGGVIADNGYYNFAKVRVEDAPYWYLAPRGVKAGDRVLVPFGKGNIPREGAVERVESCSAHTAPVPVGRAREILGVIENP